MVKFWKTHQFQFAVQLEEKRSTQKNDFMQFVHLCFLLIMIRNLWKNKRQTMDLHG